MTDPAAPASEPDLPTTLRQAADGDAEAWATLVEAYSGRVFGLLLQRCGDRELAEELTQATFVKLVSKLDDFAGYQERGRFEPWLFRIAINKLRDEMRRRKRQASSFDMSPGATGSGERASAWAAVETAVTRDGGRIAPDAGQDPYDALSRAEQIELLRQAIGQMSEPDQEILHLRHTAGLSFAEIAQTLDQPLGTVLARGHRALKKLRAALEQMGVAPGS